MPASSQFGYLLYQLTLRDLKARYKQTLLGSLWALGRPLLELAVYAVVFGAVLKAPTDGLPYNLFAYTGVVLWSVVGGALPRGTRSITAHAGLVARTPFPKLAIPLSAVLAALVDTALASIVLVVLAVHYAVPLTWAIWWILPVLFLLITLVTGLTLLASALHVFYHDLGHAVELGVRVWQLLTPVAYAASAVPAAYQSLYRLNPMVALFDAGRECLLRGHAPEVSTLLYPATFAAAALGLGMVVFRATEPYFAESV